MACPRPPRCSSSRRRNRFSSAGFLLQGATRAARPPSPPKRHLPRMPALPSVPSAASRAAFLGLLAGAALLPAQAQGAAVTVTAKGAGFGHGIGMSQYGAYGQAKAG